jgi:hypothetical protein
MNRNRMCLAVFVSVVATVATWYMNHELGYGALIANGFIGVLVGLSLPADLAGAAFTASFVGMSAGAIIPSLGHAVLGGVIAGIVIVATLPVYGGIGGKGGTTAATSVLITRGIMRLLGI